ncbi:MAG: hypothetical protein AAFY38_01695 [Pseudomonadota bacterium]
MIGVILWSDVADRKAVVWCEDQGDLAFLSGQDAVLYQDLFFDIGDVVQFDVKLERSFRRASNAKLLQQGAGSGAVEQLQTMAASQRATPNSAQIIPFHTVVEASSKKSGRKAAPGRRNA